jgi:hypothetical protein
MTIKLVARSTTNLLRIARGNCYPSRRDWEVNPLVWRRVELGGWLLAEERQVPLRGFGQDRLDGLFHALVSSRRA